MFTKIFIKTYAFFRDTSSARAPEKHLPARGHHVAFHLPEFPRPLAEVPAAAARGAAERSAASFLEFLPQAPLPPPNPYLLRRPPAQRRRVVGTSSCRQVLVLGCVSKATLFFLIGADKNN